MADFDELTEEEQRALDGCQDPDLGAKDRYKWDEELQREVIGLLLNDISFIIQSADLIKPMYFANECHQLAAKIAFAHHKKYKVLPTKRQITNEVKELIKSKDQNVQVFYIGELNTIYEYYVPGIESRNYYLDKITNFAKGMAIKTAFGQCLEEYKKAPEDESTFAKIETIIRQALSVDRNIDIGLDYFCSFEERYERMLKKKETGDYFVTGFDDIDNALSGGGLGRGEIGSVMGLCFGINQGILMYDGSIKKVQDVVLGDIVMGEDSTPRNVLKLSRGYGKLYKIVPIKGNPFIVTENHILSLKHGKSPSKTKRKNGIYTRPNIPFYNHPSRVAGTDIFNISVADFLKSTAHFQKTAKLWRTGVDWEAKPVLVDPYILGLWLGDGSANKTQITNIDEEVLFAIESEAEKREMRTSYNGHYGWSIVNKSGLNNTLLDDLRTYNLVKIHKSQVEKMPNLLSGEKHIPNEYKYNSREVRLQVLAGLIDSDGHRNCNGYEFTNKNKQLAEDVQFLARSLGFACYLKKCKKTCKNNGKMGIYYRMHISGNCNEIPVKITRKKCNSRKQIKNVLYTGFKIEEVPDGEYYGFTVDKNHLFLLDDFTVTHNSGTGKSIFLVNAAIANIHRGKKVLYISLEIDQDKCAERFDAQFANPNPYGEANNGVSIKTLYENKEVVFDALRSYISDKDDQRLLIVRQFSAGSMDMALLRAYYAQLSMNGFKPDLVIVDYIGEMKDYPGMQVYESRQRLVRELRGMGTEEGFAVMTAMQPDGKSREAVKLGGVIDDDNLADSKGQIRPLDALWSINQTQDEKECGLARIFVIKHRDGKSRFEIHIQFDYNTLKMRQISLTKYKAIHSKFKNEKTVTVTEAMKVEESMRSKKKAAFTDVGYTNVEDAVRLDAILDGQI